MALTMTGTGVAVYDDRDDAEHAVRDLTAAGIPQDHVTMVTRTRDESILRAGFVTPKAATAAAGAALGGFSGLLLGLAVSTIPGIGPVLAVGPFLGALAGAGLGAVAGAAIGPDYVPPEDLDYFAEAVRRGGTVVAVTGDEQMLDVAAEILARYPAIDLEERVVLWRRQGWERFDPSADPTASWPDHQEAVYVSGAGTGSLRCPGPRARNTGGGRRAGLAHNPASSRTSGA